MSSTATFGVLIATAAAAYVVIIYASNALNRHVDMIVCGVFDGVPMSRRHRYHKLSHIYVGQLGAVIAIAMIFAFGFASIADQSSDPAMRTWAYLVAGLGVFGALQWLVLGISYGLYCLRVLREDRTLDPQETPPASV